MNIDAFEGPVYFRAVTKYLYYLSFAFQVRNFLHFQTPIFSHNFHIGSIFLISSDSILELIFRVNSKSLLLEFVELLLLHLGKKDKDPRTGFDTAENIIVIVVPETNDVFKD